MRMRSLHSRRVGRTSSSRPSIAVIQIGASLPQFTLLHSGESAEEDQHEVDRVLKALNSRLPHLYTILACFKVVLGAEQPEVGDAASERVAGLVRRGGMGAVSDSAAGA